MAKKVLIIGPDFYGYNYSISKAFIKLGWDTKVINFAEKFPHDLKNKILCSTLSKVGINYFINKYDIYINEKILNYYDNFKPDLVFIIKGHKIFEKTLIKMKKAIKVLWMMDSIFNVPNTYKHINYYDYRFMFEFSDVTKLKTEKINCYFLPLGVDDEIYYPLNIAKKDIDILFVGALYENRLKILNELIKVFPNLNIKIYGNYANWKTPNRYINLYFKKYNRYFMNDTVSPSILNQLYSRTKIALNIHHNQSKYGCNQRFFEILGSKGFQLVDSNPYIYQEFLPGKHFVVYNNINELLNNIENYLYNELKRKKISYYGYKIVKENHTFLHRIKKVLEIVYNS